MSRTILVVDDEPQIRTVIRSYLRSEGFDVLEAGTAEQALGLADRADLVLLDVGLPDGDGIEVLRQIRTRSQVYVILVTARAEEMDKLIGLSVGADDYVTKPFSPRELVVRVKTVLRRSRSTPEPGGRGETLRFEGLCIDPGGRELRVDDQPITLSALEFDLLVALAAAPGRVYSRSQLLEKVWGQDFFGDQRVVDVHIRSMRKALQDDASAPRFIATVRGVGYKFVGRQAHS